MTVGALSIYEGRLRESSSDGTTIIAPDFVDESEETIMGKGINVIDSDRVVEAGEENIPLIDVRPAFMYEEGHIPGAVNVPLVVPEDGSMIPDDQLVQAIEAAGVEPDADVVLYCQTGQHAGLAANTLAENGFSDIELYSGSMDDWTAKDLPVSKG